MFTKSASNQRPSLTCQFNLTHSAITGAVLARNQTFLDQPIDGHTDGSGGEPDHRADRIDRKRSLMQERFENAEIRVAQFCPLDAFLRVRGECVKSLHQDEPDMHSGGIRPLLGPFLSHLKLIIDESYIDVNIMYIKQRTSMKITAVIARFLLGLIFLVFGLNGFLHFLPAPPPSGTAGQFVGALFVSNYLSVVFLLQLIAAVLFLINRYVPLALTLLAPIIVNILLFHILMAPSGLLLAIVVAVLWTLVFLSVRSAFSGLLQPRVPAQSS